MSSTVAANTGHRLRPSIAEVRPLASASRAPFIRHQAVSAMKPA